MDIRRVKFSLCLLGAAALTACGAMQQQAEETKARGTVETGGYTWRILAESEGGNTISTNGIPSRQHATDASATLCKKNGRIPQFVKQTGAILLGIQKFEFNCVK